MKQPLEMRGRLIGAMIVIAAAITQLLPAGSVHAQSSAQSGIYVGGHFRRERDHTVADLKASGFTNVILFSIRVEASGDLTTDSELIATNGAYVFNNTSPYYASDVASLKAAPTSILRVETTVGGWGDPSYNNIQSLVQSGGTGLTSILYRNFLALKNALPGIDAINNDDEQAYDISSATAFHILLADVGFKSTLAPYTNPEYWKALATNVNAARPGAVDKNYLQVYEGGAFNNPCDWLIDNVELHTGDLYTSDPGTAIAKMTSAKDSCGAVGGYLWVYNANDINLTDWAARINAVFSPVVAQY